jgi:hypothetical protein
MKLGAKKILVGAEKAGKIFLTCTVAGAEKVLVGSENF